jgi:hypothetical protein
MSISTQTPPSSFTGTLAYVQNGQVIHADLSGKGGRRKTVPGDHVESCVVQKTSDGPGSIQVTIYEDGKRVFDSGQVESQEPITYTNSLGGAQTKPSVGEAGELSAATAGRFEFRWVARDEETNSPADWLADASGTDSSRTLCILKEVLLDGDAVASAGFARFEPDHREISVLLTDEGGRKFAALTAANIGRRLAIVWNGRVLSAPVIRDAITSRQVMITSNLRDEESLLLVNVLNHRNLPERAADDQSNIQAELRDAKTQLAELRRRGYTDSHPSVALLRDRIKKLEGK